jgi:hypothetical protein
MLRRVAFVRTDVSKERSASFIRVTRTGELGTTLAVTNNRSTLRRNTNLTKYKPVLSSGRAPHKKKPVNVGQYLKFGHRFGVCDRY